MQVRLFGILREIADSGVLSVPAHLATTTQLEDWLLTTHPHLDPHRPYWRLAVDGEYVGGETPLKPDSEVAIMPPVSGG